ncbi:hypothetical protein [Streptomyces crystallinus]|uniref:Uncharacterized protein n=1 Tax=Streptomyces crystallinus TaxID=68191 RepID=A0ABP3S955_9ACTN
MQGEKTVTGTVTDRFEREMQRRREERPRPVTFGWLRTLRTRRGRER